jgi:hypothetical protein
LNTAYRLSCYLLFLPLVLGAALVGYLLTRPGEEPPTYYSTWCPPAEMREALDRSVTEVQAIARLRDIRCRLREAVEDARLGDPEVAGRIDGMIRDLIADLDLAAMPLTREVQP